MATDISTAAPTSEVKKAGRRRLPPELSILAVMIGMMLLFEVLGWMFVGQSFIANPLRLRIMILQEAEIGIIAVGVTQVIIMGGIDLSSGSVVGMTARMLSSGGRRRRPAFLTSEVGAAVEMSVATGVVSSSVSFFGATATRAP